MKRTIFILTCLCLPNILYAQEQFVVTQAQDTLYGKVNAFIFSKNVILKTPEGKKTFPIDQLKWYKNRKHTIRIVKHRSGGELRVHRLSLEVDGKLPLFRDWDKNMRKWAVYHDGKFVELNEDNCDTWLWPMLMSCEIFARQLGDWSNFHVRRLWYDSSWRTEYALTIYNSLCD